MIASQRAVRVRALALSAVTTALLSAAACAGTPPLAHGATAAPPTADQLAPGAQLAARAALAQDQFYSAEYRFIPAGGGADGELRVARIHEAFSMALTEPAGAGRVQRTTEAVTNATGTFRCRITATAGACVPGARAGAPGDDPVSRLQSAFTTWLRVLADRSAALSVTAAATPSSASGTCFSVQGVAAALEPPVDPGLYCFDQRGMLTFVQLPAGSAALAGSAAPPAEIPLPAPVGDALPSVDAAGAIPSPSETALPATDTPAPSAPSATAPR